MSRNGKVIMAMSGGVDSSVAAWMLREQGYEVVGVFLRVGAHVHEPSADASLACPTLAATRRLRHGCCSATDAIDARAVAGRLGIPFYALNFEKEFERIIDYFVDEYARARTPNPCVMCNIRVKFGRLLQYADAMDAEFVATGHYARIVLGDGSDDCAVRLARARNLAKDQSYVLFGIRRDVLRRCLFPLGEATDKARVRQIAAELGLRVHDKPDSQEICFVPDQDYRRLVRQRRPDSVRTGEIRDSSQRVLGVHEGVAGFTIGQRRGLGLAAGRPVYVTRLDVLNNVVTVGDRDGLLAAGLVADAVNWLVEPSAGAVRAEIKIRHMSTPAAGLFMADGPDSFQVWFDEPQPAVTPGQAAVLYDGDGVVLGGGWIREAASEPAARPA
ncbi:MAG: tRNA 2-thiouridine(34) synthase MnmA [Phycisphaerae bacterium]